MEETKERYEPVKQDALDMGEAALAVFERLVTRMPEELAVGVAERLALAAYASLMEWSSDPARGDLREVVEDAVDDAMFERFGPIDEESIEASEVSQ
jgi:hypothetical protein